MKRALAILVVTIVVLGLLASGISCTKTVYITATPTPTSALSTTPSPTPSTEIYLVKTGMLWNENDRYMQLKTIASWQGTSSKKWKFNFTKVPCIINYGWKETSNISSRVDVNAWDKNNISPMAGEYNGIWKLEIDEVGERTIDVQSVGAKWWVKIGVEQ